MCCFWYFFMLLHILMHEIYQLRKFVYVSLFSLVSHGSPERHQYLVRAVKWSCGDTYKLGHPRLHQLLAQTLWKGMLYQVLFFCNLVICSCIHILHYIAVGWVLDVTGPMIYKFTSEKNYGSARYHYLRSEDGGGCADMLVELHLLRGYPSEIDLFLTQAVLQ